VQGHTEAMRKTATSQNDDTEKRFSGESDARLEKVGAIM